MLHLKLPILDTQSTRYCIFTNGVIPGTTLGSIKFVANENECARQVAERWPEATGVTYIPESKKCNAETEPGMDPSTNLRACLFSPGKPFLKLYITLHITFLN